VRYSDTNYQLLMLIIEAAAGRPLGSVYEEFFWQPLGLRETRLPDQAGRAALPLYAGGRVLERPLALASSRDLIAPAREAAAFLRALLTGQAFARPATAALMQGPWRRFGFPLDRAALRSPSWPIEYGLGMMRFRLPRWLTPTGPVPELAGHSGSTGSWLFYCPELGLIFAGTVDEAGSGAVPFQHLPRLLRTLQQAPFR
jgi:CubicO group peptidase (beta-lactamase class C family)